MGKDQHIVRFEYGSTRSWFVRIERASGTYRKNFSDGVYGGKRKALAEARLFRDKALRKAPAAPRLGAQLGPGRLKRVERQYQRNGKSFTYQAWYAWIRVAPGQMAATTWSIDKWGSAEAKKRAKEWLLRKQKEQRKSYGKSATG